MARPVSTKMISLLFFYIFFVSFFEDLKTSSSIHKEGHEYSRDREELAKSERWRSLVQARPTAQRVKVLTIDGGGVRGIMPAEFLRRLEDYLASQYQRPVAIADVFDLIVGTSTGGILSIGLTQPRPLEVLLYTTSTAQFGSATPFPVAGFAAPPFPAGVIPSYTMPYCASGPFLTADSLVYPFTQFAHPYDTASLAYSSPLSRPTPRTAGEMVELYKNLANTIFGLSFYERPMRSLASLFSGPKYSAKPFEKALQEAMGKARFSASLTNVVVVSTNAHNGCTRLLRSYAGRYNRKEDFFARDVARGTSAAPTYFPPAEIFPVCFQGTRDKSKALHLVDGGLSANNPSAIAYAEALKLFPGKGIDLVSLGTGAITDDISAWDSSKRIGQRGAARWAKPAIDMLQHGNSETVHNTLLRISESDKSKLHYYRFQYTDLPKQLKPMDDHRNVPALHACTDFMLIDPHRGAAAPRDRRQIRQLQRGQIEHVVRELGLRPWR